MSTATLFQVLEIIHPLPADFKIALEKELQFSSFPKGYFLVKDQLIARDAYFLDSGFAVSYRQYETRKMVTTFWPAHRIILSPKSFFAQSPAEEAIQLTEASDLWCVSYPALHQLFEMFPVANSIARTLLAHCHSDSEQHIADLHYLSAWQRYLKVVRLYPRIEQHVSQDLMASYLNITPQSLSRLKHKNQGKY